MNASSIFGSLLFAVALGLMVTLLSAEARVVSLEVWLTATLLWTMGLVIRRALRVLPPVPTRPVGLVRRSVANATPVRRPQSLRTIERIVQQSVHEPRSYVAQLQPRLVDLAEHRLGSSAGLPEHQHLLRATGSMTRAPTVQEIDDLLSAILGPAPDRSATATDLPSTPGDDS